MGSGPEDCIHSCRAALRITMLGEAFSNELKDDYMARTMSQLPLGTTMSECEKLIIPHLKVQCGVHSAMTNCIAKDHTNRAVYTVPEPMIEIATELSNLNIYGAQLLLTEAAHDQLIAELATDQADCVTRQIDMIRLESDRKVMKLHEVLAVAEVGHVSATMLKALRVFNFAFDCYKKGAFQGALQLFQSAYNISHGDLASKVFMERCETFLQHKPGKNWCVRWGGVGGERQTQGRLCFIATACLRNAILL